MCIAIAFLPLTQVTMTQQLVFRRPCNRHLEKVCESEATPSCRRLYRCISWTLEVARRANDSSVCSYGKTRQVGGRRKACGSDHFVATDMLLVLEPGNVKSSHAYRFMSVKKAARLSVPGPRRTVSAAVEERAAHIRNAVNFLEPSLRTSQAESDFSSIFAPRWLGESAFAVTEPPSLRAAWALVNIAILARMAGAMPADDTLGDAEKWFFGGRRELPSLAAHIPPDAAANSLLSILQNSLDDAFLELLPYVLEVHGPGSRMSVMRDPTTRMARAAKRETGVFYTPADVAEYMAAGVLAGRSSPEKLRYIDPSCGTGVFFVAILRTLLLRPQHATPFDCLEFATRSLYGIDISTLAVESSTFVLLNHCMSSVKKRGIAPWAAWHALRLNLTATDALKVRVARPLEPPTGAIPCRTALKASLLEPSTGIIQPLIYTRHIGNPEVQLGLLIPDQGLHSLGDVFPEAERGFEVLICNPPYANLRENGDQRRLGTEYYSLQSAQAANCNLYPMFIEMMWRLTCPENSTSAVVVPLSISYHRGDQYKACRQGMVLNGGRWQCAFFDREPHALFGEDVKTRNAILFRHELSQDPPRGKKAIFETGPLRKWTSRTREKLFSTIAFTPLKRVNITNGLPKLHGPEQASAFSVFANSPDSLKTLSYRCRTCRPQEATCSTVYPRVFVASTAYNFLNVFRSFTLDSGAAYPLSENTVHCMEFHQEELAELAFGILSSRLTFWLWHVQGDAFHVAASFIQNLPFGKATFNIKQREILCHAARTLWQSLQSHRIVSINRGKQTIAFRPLACEKERNVIDSVLIEAARLPKSFARTLTEFVRSTVVVDETDVRRNHLKSVFEVMENLA